MKKYSNDSITRVARSTSSHGRREFLESAAVAAATGLFAGGSLEAAGSGKGSGNPASGKHREQEAYQLRVEAARHERDRPPADHPTNGDEARYASKFANYSKGLPHNALGEVQLPAWESLIHALETGDPEDFERIQMSGSAKLVTP